MEKISDVPIINIALDTIKINKQALIFVNTKRSAEKTAEEIAKKIKTDNNELREISEIAINALSKPTRQCERLALVLKKGLAFHHAGLVQKQRELIEDNFRKGLIKIICATPTLSFGVDLPAFRSILKDLKRYGHRGLDWMPTLEVQQMFGRAGRPKYDTVGEAICIAGSEAEKEKIYKRYIIGKPEEIQSKLIAEPALRTYLLSLISSNFISTKKQIIDFFGKTFSAYQFKHMAGLTDMIERMLHLLEEWGFIISNEDDFIPADEFSNSRYKSTVLGKRVSELYLDPLTAHNFHLALQKASSIKPNSFSFLQMLSHSLEIRPLISVRMKEYDEIQSTLLRYSETLLEEEPSMFDPEYDDFLRSVKTALMFMDWTDEKPEDYLMENFNIRPGELRTKLLIADWLMYAADELARILKFKFLLKDIMKLRLRLKHGIKEELLPLIQLEQIGRVRARKLYFNDIKDIADVKKADLMKLTQILGKEIALNVKRQVDQSVIADQAELNSF